jgi:hypothetical protein
MFFSLVAACGDDSTTGLVCGAGTVPMGGMCVPAEDACGAGTMYDAATMTCVPTGNIMCAAGTVLMGDECVPDGSVICTSGTMYDPSTGTCIPDISGCGPGTMEVDGECVPADRPVGDNIEGAEPNDITIEDVVAPEFMLPAIGASTSFSGCVEPADFDDDGALDADFDSWTFTVTRPTMINVRVDGFEGLAAGFVVSSQDELLANDTWIRLGIDLTSSHAERRILLPAAGTYFISFSDSRSALFGLTAGSEDSCYYATIETEALPTATPLVDGMAMGTDFGDPMFYSFTATEGQLLFPTLAEDSVGVHAAIVQIVDDAYAGSAIAQFDDSPDVTSLLLDLDDGAEVFVVVDHVYDIALDPVEWTLDVGDSGAQPLEPGDNTFTHRDTFYEWRYFDATAGDVVNLEFDGGGTDGFDMAVVSPLRRLAAYPCEDCTDSDSWFQALETGRHYVRIYNFDGTDGTDYTVSFDTLAVTPRDLTRGTAGAADLTGASRDFFRIDVSDMDWLTFDVGSLVNLTDALVRVYPNGETGALDIELAAAEEDTASSLGGFGRIFEADASYLISVEDDDGHDGDETLELTVRDRAYTDLGTVTEAAAIAPMAAAIAADETLYFLVHAETGSQVTVTATADASEDLVLSRLDRTEAVRQTVDAGAGGASEMLVHQLGTDYMPFTLSEYDGDAGSAMVGVTSLDPPYSAASGTSAFVDVCTAGEVHALTADWIFPAEDDGLSTNPVTFSTFTFSYFGMPVTSLLVSSNGWISFDTTATDSRYSNPASFPETGDPDAIIAPFWDDMRAVEVCTLEEASRLVVQWTGSSYSSSSVQYQVVLHTDGRIEFIYGPDHLQPTGALVGIENQDATFGLTWTEPVLFETSVLITPS